MFVAAMKWMQGILIPSLEIIIHILLCCLATCSTTMLLGRILWLLSLWIINWTRNSKPWPLVASCLTIWCCAAWLVLCVEVDLDNQSASEGFWLLTGESLCNIEEDYFEYKANKHTVRGRHSGDESRICASEGILHWDAYTITRK